MSRILRRAAPGVAALASAALVAGCGTAPDRAGQAVIVGNSTVSLAEIQGELRWLLDNVATVRQEEELGALDSRMRLLVRTHVHGELLAVAEEREGLRADPSDVGELIEAFGGASEMTQRLGVHANRVSNLARDQVLLRELGERYIAGTSVDILGAEVAEDTADATARERAEALGERIAEDPGQARELIAEAGHEVLGEELDAAELVEDGATEAATSALFGVEAGTVVVRQRGGQQTAWMVALVTDRTAEAGEDGEDGEDGDEIDLAELDPQVAREFGLRMLAPLAEDLGVEVNPRYGLWDSFAMDVVESEEHTAGRVISAQAEQP